MKMLTLFIFIISGISSTYCQNYDNNRPAFILRLAIDNNTFSEYNIKSSPYIIKDKMIQLYPGESIFVEAEINKDSLINLKSVKEIKDTNITMIFEFKQITDKKLHKYMELKVLNPFEKILNYKAKILLMNNEKWVDTNVLPIKNGIYAYEQWPDIIISVLLSEWRLQHEKE